MMERVAEESDLVGSLLKKLWFDANSIELNLVRMTFCDGEVLAVEGEVVFDFSGAASPADDAEFGGFDVVWIDVYLDVAVDFSVGS